MLVRGTNIESEKTSDLRGILEFRDTVWIRYVGEVIGLAADLTVENNSSQPD